MYINISEYKNLTSESCCKKKKKQQKNITSSASRNLHYTSPIINLDRCSAKNHQPTFYLFQMSWQRDCSRSCTIACDLKFKTQKASLIQCSGLPLVQLHNRWPVPFVCTGAFQTSKVRSTIVFVCEMWIVLTASSRIDSARFKWYINQIKSQSKYKSE